MADEPHPLDRPVPPPAKQDPLTGSLVAGRYRVDALLGEGGMGQVYRAVHVAIEKPIALKILRPEHSAQHEIVGRFHQEAISASRIKHPHVLDVFDFGQLENGQFFLAMELLEGHDLADELVRDGTVEPERAVALTLQIARGLAAAHDRGVVHRDLKPENVFLQRTSDGECVKIVDFGIAQLRSGAPGQEPPGEPVRRRLTRTGMIFGTPEYMSPEQALGAQADARSDIYSLGVLLYEMLTGAVPFTGETFMGVLTAHVTGRPPPLRAMNASLEASPPLEALICGLLEKDPARRPQSMSEVALQLAALPEASTLYAARPHGDAEIGLVPPERRARVRTGAATLPRVPHARPDEAPNPPASHPSSRAAVTLDLVRRREPPPTTREPPPANPTSDPLGQVQPGAPGARARPRQLARVWSAAGVLVTVAAVAALWAGHRRAPDTSIAPTRQRDSSEGEGSPAQNASRAVSVSSPAAAPAPLAPPASTVTLAVRTAPSGALLFMDGAQVCDQTPCHIIAPRNELVGLEAKRGSASGKARVLAQNDQSVDISLLPDTPRARPPEPKLCERYSEELGIKIAVPCR